MSGSLSLMLPKTDFSEFFKLVVAEIGTIPMRGVVLIFAASVASSAAGMLLLAQADMILAVEAAIVALLLIGWAAIIYALSMMMAASPLGIGSFIRYILTACAAVMPLLAAFGLMLLAGAWGSAILMAPALALFFLFIFATSLFSGWPVMQATSASFVGPIAALKLTRGFRWPLVVAGVAAGAINRVVPAATESDGLAAALVLGLVGAIASAFSGMFAASISIAAWRLMLANQRTQG